MSTLALLDATRSDLAGVPREALGELQERRLLGVARAPRIVRRGDAWHLGALLLTDDALLATGEIFRAREPARRGFTAESQRRRAQLQEAARRGGFAEGETVHVGWEPIDIGMVDRGEASGPLALVDGVPSVRWSAAGGLVPLSSYLAERVELARNPPAGA